MRRYLLAMTVWWTFVAGVKVGLAHNLEPKRAAVLKAVLVLDTS